MVPQLTPGVGRFTWPPVGRVNWPLTVEPCQGSVDDFVNKYFSLITEVRTGGPIVWCASWWAHPEAIMRLTALGRAREALRLEPGTGTSDWWTLHLDPDMRVLLVGERGPFASSPGKAPGRQTGTFASGRPTCRMRTTLVTAPCATTGMKTWHDLKARGDSAGRVPVPGL